MWEMERNTLIEVGREKGMAEGIAKGKAEGKEQKQKEIALRMLETGYKPAEISKLTNFSEQEIAHFNQSGLTSPDD